MCGRTWELSVFSIRFCCELKIAPKTKAFKKNSLTKEKYLTLSKIIVAKA